MLKQTARVLNLFLSQCFLLSAYLSFSWWVRRPLPPVKYSTFRPRQYQSQRDNKPRLPTAIWRVDCNAKCTGRRHAPAGCHLAMCWTRSFMSKKTPLLYARKRAQSTGQGDTRTSAIPPAGCATDGATRPQRHRSCLLHTAQLNLTLALPSWAAPGRLLTVVFRGVISPTLGKIKEAEGKPGPHGSPH